MYQETIIKGMVSEILPVESYNWQGKEYKGQNVVFMCDAPYEQNQVLVRFNPDKHKVTAMSKGDIAEIAVIPKSKQNNKGYWNTSLIFAKFISYTKTTTQVQQPVQQSVQQPVQQPVYNDGITESGDLPF